MMGTGGCYRVLRYGIALGDHLFPTAGEGKLAQAERIGDAAGPLATRKLARRKWRF
jgi:hypothetical protein